MRFAFDVPGKQDVEEGEKDSAVLRDLGEEQLSQQKTEKVTTVKVEDIKPIEDSKELIPYATMPIVKAIAERPKTARLIFHLEKHGVTSQNELCKALEVKSNGTIWWIVDKLQKGGFPIVKIKDPYDKSHIYYDFERSEPMSDLLGEQVHPQLESTLKEIHKWFNYYALKKFESALPEHEWAYLEDLESDSEFLKLIRYWGFTFERAILLLMGSGVLYVKGKGEEIHQIKRAFDNRGHRLEKSYVGNDISNITREALELVE